MGYREFKSINRDNRGFTLVEVLIAVALVAVVGTAVFGFMTVGARTFTSTSADVNLQSEAQLAFNQMQDLIIDTAIGIDYCAAPDSATDLKDYTSYTIGGLDDSAWPATIQGKKLILYNQDIIYELTWIKEEEKLYYREFPAHANASNEVVRDDPTNPAVDWALMAEYMTDFSVDLSLMQDKRIVRIDTLYKKGNQEYNSSHNITLRNRPLSGNSIPAYVTPSADNEPRGIIGRDRIYLKPGETIGFPDIPMVDPGENIYDIDSTGAVTSTILVSSSDASSYRGYKLRYDDYNDTTGEGYDFPGGPQDIHYSIRPGQTDCYSTIDPDTGILTVSPMQVKSFDVTVTGESGIYTRVKSVKVNIIRVTSVGVDFSAADTVSRNMLKEGDVFTLTATVSANNADKTSDASGDAIDWSVKWDITNGGSMVVETGTKTGPDAAHKSTCEFKMQNVTATNKDIEILATSKESVDLNYKKGPSGAVAPVVGKFNDKTYKKPEDPHKKFEEKNGSNLKRGQEYVVNLAYGAGNGNALEDSLKLKDGTAFEFGPGMLKVLDVKVEETVSDLSGEKDAQDITEVVTTNNEIRIMDGASWKFYSPVWYNPNASYRYVLAHYVYKHPNNPDYWDPDQSFITMEQLQAMYEAAGKTPTEDDILADGTVLDTTFPRMKLQYHKTNETPNNFVVDTEKKQVAYYPRSFNTKNPSTEFPMNFTFDISFDLSNGEYNQNLKGLDWKEFKCYKADASGEYSYGVSSDPSRANKVDVASEYEVNVREDNGNPYLNILEFGNPRDSVYNKKLPGFKVQFFGYDKASANKKVWESIDKEVRIVPVVTIKKPTEAGNTAAGRYDGDYVLFDSYIEMHNWDIDIPGTGLIAKILGEQHEGAAERSYFPLPGDYNFPGEYVTYNTAAEPDIYTDENELRHIGRMKKVNGIEEWTGGKEWVGSCCHYTSWKHPDMIYYTLDEHSGGEWWLTLFAARSNGELRAFMRYTCEENGDSWDYVETFKYSDVGDLPILKK